MRPWQRVQWQYPASSGGSRELEADAAAQAASGQGSGSSSSSSRPRKRSASSTSVSSGSASGSIISGIVRRVCRLTLPRLASPKFSLSGPGPVRSMARRVGRRAASIKPLARRRIVSSIDEGGPVGRIVVTEFVSLDGVIEDPGGSENFKYGGWSFEFSRGDEGDKFKLDEALDSAALLLGRVTYEGFAAAWPSQGGGVRRQVQQHAEVRRLLDARGRRLEQLDRDHGRRSGAGREAEGRDRRRHRRSRERPARADAARARPRGRAAADGVPGRARERKAPLRRDQRQEASAAGRLQGRSATAWTSRSTSALRRRTARRRGSAQPAARVRTSPA